MPNNDLKQLLNEYEQKRNKASTYFESPVFGYWLTGYQYRGSLETGRGSGHFCKADGVFYNSESGIC